MPGTIYKEVTVSYPDDILETEAHIYAAQEIERWRPQQLDCIRLDLDGDDVVVQVWEKKSIRVRRCCNKIILGA